MSLNIVVLAKQVPDTRNVGKDAMTPEGTVNRAALPAIFNPEDLNALEQALRLKEQNPGSTVSILTMGPPRATEVIREGLYRGADCGYLLTDRAFAGADTLATSYALSMAIKKIGKVDIVIGGRQAIDGDTAQVGPQVAQKLDLNQVTYVEEVLSCADGKITVRRHIDGGIETVEAPAAHRADRQRQRRPLPPAQRQTRHEVQTRHGPHGDARRVALCRRIQEEALPHGDPNGARPTSTPTSASAVWPARPPRLKAVQNIVFKAKESKRLGSSDSEVEGLVQELLASHTIG